MARPDHDATPAPRRPRPQRAGFTLVEVLVVMAIVALLVAVLLPAVGKARLSAQRAVSRTNVGALAGTVQAYATEYRDALVNPFDTRNAARYAGLTGPGGAINWWHVIEPKYVEREGTVVASRFDQAPTRCSELFALYWATQMTAYLNTADYAPPVIRAPYDRRLQLRQGSQLAAPASAAYGTEMELFDTSYLLSPTLWLAPERYASANHRAINASLADGLKHWRRNRLDQVVDPAAKVTIFERFDHSRRARAADVPPQFNAPDARTLVAAADGSVAEADLARLTALAADPDTGPALRPSGQFDIPVAEFARFDGPSTRIAPLAEDPWQTEAGSRNGGSFPAFFWATRGGIRGRDLFR